MKYTKPITAGLFSLALAACGGSGGSSGGSGDDSGSGSDRDVLGDSGSLAVQTSLSEMEELLRQKPVSSESATGTWVFYRSGEGSFTRHNNGSQFDLTNMLAVSIIRIIAVETDTTVELQFHNCRIVRENQITYTPPSLSIDKSSFAGSLALDDMHDLGLPVPGYPIAGDLGITDIDTSSYSSALSLSDNRELVFVNSMMFEDNEGTMTGERTYRFGGLKVNDDPFAMIGSIVTNDETRDLACLTTYAEDVQVVEGSPYLQDSHFEQASLGSATVDLSPGAPEPELEYPMISIFYSNSVVDSELVGPPTSLIITLFGPEIEPITADAIHFDDNDSYYFRASTVNGLERVIDYELYDAATPDVHFSGYVEISL